MAKNFGAPLLCPIISDAYPLPVHREVINKYDEDQNGVIDLDEFMEFVDGYPLIIELVTVAACVIRLFQVVFVYCPLLLCAIT